MSLNRYSEGKEKLSYESFVSKDDHDQDFYQKDEKGHADEDYGCEKDSCDSRSARALKKILSLLDDLNNHDLRILDDIIERLLCSRDSKKDY